MIAIIAGLIGLLLGAALGWLSALVRGRTGSEARVHRAEISAATANAAADALRAELGDRKAEIADLRSRLGNAESARAALEAGADEMSRRFTEQRSLLGAAEAKLSDTFKSLAADILKTNGESFLTLACERFETVQVRATADLAAREAAVEQIVAPAREALSRLGGELRRIENDRRDTTAVLTTQLQTLASQTNSLVNALKTPTVRGRWGEIQLRRVTEIAGMVDHCDFDEQASVTTSDGRLRPDMTIRLPVGKCIVVDAKAPLQGYLEALDAPTEADRTARLGDHARQIRSHIDQLGAKAYWSALPATPEFVVMFLPGEMFFSAALQQDSSLIEYAAQRNVILATPTTLISLLKAVSYGWRQEQLAENASRISKLGSELYDRIVVMTEHLANVGGTLKASVKAFNDTVGSLEGRVLPAARRFRELGVGGKQEIKELASIAILPREPALLSNGADGNAK